MNRTEFAGLSSFTFQVGKECAMEPLKFWSFVLRCIAKSASESADFFELKMRALLIGIVLLALGFGLLWLVKGPEVTREEFHKYLLLIPAPAVLFLAGLFLFNIFRAPHLIYLEQYGKARADADEVRKTWEAKIMELKAQLAEKPREVIKTVAQPAEGPPEEPLKLTLWNYAGQHPLGNAKEAVTSTEIIVIANKKLEAPINLLFDYEGDIAPTPFGIPPAMPLVGTSMTVGGGRVIGRQLIVHIDSPSVPAYVPIRITTESKTQMQALQVRLIK